MNSDLISFRFADDKLQKELVVSIGELRRPFRLGKDATVYYPRKAEADFENELICPIRDKVFRNWQLLFCPQSAVNAYRTYMRRRGIPYQEEITNDEVAFLLPKTVRPHAWKVSSPEGDAVHRANA
jgi:hypothetical protein